MAELYHECGVAAIYHRESSTPSRLAPMTGPEQVSRLMPRMLLDLQNRGQLAAGFTTFNPQRDKLLDTHKQIGTVIEAFRLNHQDKYNDLMSEFAGPAAIGHVRYATCGATERRYAQPFDRFHGCKWKWFSFAFNGQLANFAELRDELLTQADYHLTRNTDTEVIMHHIGHQLRGDGRPDLVDVFAFVTAHDLLELEVGFGGSQLDFHGCVTEWRQLFTDAHAVIADGHHVVDAGEARRTHERCHDEIRNDETCADVDVAEHVHFPPAVRRIVLPRAPSELEAQTREDG